MTESTRMAGPRSASHRHVISIVHVITTLDVGGAETALVQLVSRLDPLRFSSTVVALRGPGTLVPRLQAAGIEARTLTDARPFGPGAVLRLVEALRRVRPVVLQTWLYHADLLGLLVGRALRVPSIGWNVRCAELAPGDHPRSLFWVLHILRRLSGLPDFVVVNSSAGQFAHQRLGYRPRRWELIPNGIDTDVFAPSEDARRLVRQELGIGADVPVVGLIARYHPMKDHATFIAACGRLLRSCPDLCVLLAGRDVDGRNSTLARAVAEHGLTGRVWLAGETPQPQRLLAAMDVAVSSSYGEGFPNVVAEGMAAGLPVVATDAGDSASIVGDCGAIVPPRDPEALAGAVQRMLALPGSTRRALGLAGRERIVREFSIDATVVRYQNLYEEFGDRAPWGPR